MLGMKMNRIYVLEGKNHLDTQHNASWLGLLSVGASWLLSLSASPIVAVDRNLGTTGIQRLGSARKKDRRPLHVSHVQWLDRTVIRP